MVRNRVTKRISIFTQMSKVVIWEDDFPLTSAVKKIIKTGHTTE